MSNSAQRITVDSYVKLSEHGSGDEEVYQLVDASKADLLQNKIPVGNPLAQALLGKKPGDEVSITGPEGELTFSVREVSRI